MNSCDKKLRNKKNLKLFLAGFAMLLLASCSSAPAVLNGNQVHAQNEVVTKLNPKCQVIDYDGFTVLFIPIGYYAGHDDGEDVQIDNNYSLSSVYVFADVFNGTGITVDDSNFGAGDYTGDADGIEILLATHTAPQNYYCVQVYDGDNYYLNFRFPVSFTNSSTFESYYDSTDNFGYVNDNVVPSSADIGIGFVHDIVDILVSGITNLGSALGQGISTTAQAMFINASNDGLSVWGVLVASFAGLALAVGLTRLVFGFITSLGGKN